MEKGLSSPLAGIWRNPFGFWRKSNDSSSVGHRGPLSSSLRRKRQDDDWDADFDDFFGEDLFGDDDDFTIATTVRTTTSTAGTTMAEDDSHLRTVRETDDEDLIGGSGDNGSGEPTEHSSTARPEGTKRNLNHDAMSSCLPNRILTFQDSIESD